MVWGKGRNNRVSKKTGIVYPFSISPLNETDDATPPYSYLRQAITGQPREREREREGNKGL
jgi:hypothetical protein